jgi:hypothetical protein
MRGFVLSFCINQLSAVPISSIEQAPNVCWVVLAVFVEGDDPFATRCCDASQSCSMLTKVLG